MNMPELIAIFVTAIGNKEFILIYITGNTPINRYWCLLVTVNEIGMPPSFVFYLSLFVWILRVFNQLCKCIYTFNNNFYIVLFFKRWRKLMDGREEKSA